MPWPWEDLSLVDRFWLLAAGPHPVAGPSYSARLGLAMAAIRAIENAGEIRWIGPDDDPVLRTISDCRCPEPLRTRHAALQSAEPPDLDGIPATYTLAPLVSSSWDQEAEQLASRGLVAIERSRLAPLGRDRYAVIDVDELQSRRRELVHLVAPPDGSVQDLPADVLDLFVVARAADAVSDLLRVPGLYPAPAVLSAIEFATQGSRAWRRLEATMRYRNAAR